MTRTGASLLSLAMLVACAFGVVGCASAPMATSATDVATAEPAVFQASQYVLGSGDRVRVNVFGQPEISGEYLVSGAGTVALPLVGDVRAAGLTLGAFQDRVRTALADGYFKDPRVSAEVLNFRPFYILGEVNKPGEYPYVSGLSLTNAVATAGGYTYRANTRIVLVKRADETTEKQYDATRSIPIAPGDTIRIPERFF